MEIFAAISGNADLTSIALPRLKDDDANYTYDVYGLPDGSLQLEACTGERQPIPADWKRYDVEVWASNPYEIYVKTDEIPHGIYMVKGYGEKKMNLRKMGLTEKKEKEESTALAIMAREAKERMRKAKTMEDRRQIALDAICDLYDFVLRIPVDDTIELAKIYADLLDITSVIADLGRREA